MPKDKSNNPDEKLIGMCVTRTIESLQLHDSFKKLIKEATKKIESDYKKEISVLKTEIKELKSSTEFINSKYDELKEKYDKLLKCNTKQKEELNSLVSTSKLQSEKVIADTKKIDELDQYNRRQNLEFHGIPLTQSEDATKIVVEMCELIGCEINQNDISIAHRLPPTKKQKESNEPPPIIARFVSRNVRNSIYKNRIHCKGLSGSRFPVNSMEKLYINENLTSKRKKLLWMAKQAAKKLDFKYVWTMNGKILVRKCSESPTHEIAEDNDLLQLEAIKE